MSGGVNQRLVRQFRMPGLPLVLVTTDVLQQGGDLHTFCRRIAHYGIAWTPSAIEQRTGRVDRIGGLVQRRLDGSPELPPPKISSRSTIRTCATPSNSCRCVACSAASTGSCDLSTVAKAQPGRTGAPSTPPVPCLMSSKTCRRSRGNSNPRSRSSPAPAGLRVRVEDDAHSSSPHGSSVRQELIDDALARLLVFPHAGLDLLNRDRWSNKTKLSCFYAGRHPAVVSQGDRLAHLERDQESTVRSDLERLRPDCTGVRFGRSGSGGSRRLVVALLPVLILSAGPCSGCRSRLRNVR